jgi:phosphoribosylanthranilate isomerase
MTWIKICGITNLEDAQTAVDAGANALGFVFYSKSPRKVGAEAVREIIANVPAAIEKVGVFVDEEPEQIRQVVAATCISAVQLHGKRSVESVFSDPRSFDLSLGVSKIIPVLPGDSLKEDLLVSMPIREGVFALLLDAQTNGLLGGTGTTFDWNATHEIVEMISLQLPIIVAGGLTSLNVAGAMKLFQPFGVDVSSSVEAKPGKKDPEKVRAFVQAVRTAEKTA